MHKSPLVVVLGSKPDPCLPDISPLAVVAANGAIEIALEYRKRFGTKIISLVPGKDLYEQKHIRDSIRVSCPDSLYILGPIPVSIDQYVYVKNELGIARDFVKIISHKEKNFDFTIIFGWRRYIIGLKSLYLRGFRYLLFYVVVDIFTKREFGWLGRSTGINAIIFSLYNFPEAKQIVVVGVGLFSGGHFNQVGKFRSKTAKMDRLTMRHWIPAKRLKVFTTDAMLFKHGAVPLWQGKYFKSKSHDVT